MQTLSLLGFAAVVPCLGQLDQHGGHTMINSRAYLKDLVEALGGNSTWTAGTNDFFEGWSFEHARKLFGTEPLQLADRLHDVKDNGHFAYFADADVPAEFDAKTHWPGLLHPIRNQQQCGSCWAFSASEVLSDRVAIARGQVSPVLSPEDMVSCDGGDGGCQGGQLPMAWDYLQKIGIVTDACFPYTAGDGYAPECPNACVNGESWSASKVKAAKAYALDGAVAMQKELMTNGPVQVAFMVYRSFMSYNSGVYHKARFEWRPEGGHAVKLVGWGTESGTDYWLVANSWSANWGLDGYFKIKRGTNECSIEQAGPPYAGMPALVGGLVV